MSHLNFFLATTSTVNASQKPLNLDPRIGTTVASNVTSVDNAEKLLENLTVCKPTTTNDNACKSSSINIFHFKCSFLTTFSAPGGNLFSMSSFTTPTKSESPSSIFGGNAAAAAKSPFSNFGNLTIPTAAATPTTQTSIFASPFASPNVTVTSAPASTASGIFGKPDQSTFGQQKSSSIFGGNATATTPSTNVFGGNTAVATPSTSVFGGNATSTTPSSNVFGVNAATAAPSASVFGGNAFETPSSTSTAFGATTNTFGTPTSNAFGSTTSSSNIFGNSAGSGFGNVGNAGNAFSLSKSIFGGTGQTSDQPSAFGSPGSSLFGAPTTAAPTSPFGQTPQNASQSTGSLFGGSSFGSGATQQPTGSIFGGASTATTGFGQSTFGGSSFSQQSSPFGSTGASPFGSTQTSPGGFGGNPTFGGQPTFGAAATFSSPKSGFGSFANVPNTFGASPTQQNSLFESLGASDTGLSFGNIAQSSNANAQKPSSFGGG